MTSLDQTLPPSPQLPATREQLRHSIEKQFGFFPPHFKPAEHLPRVLEYLWRQTETAYLLNPLPALFKEKLIARLSRYCDSPYCVVCHSCALRAMGLSSEGILALLARPAGAAADTFHDHLRALVAAPAPLVFTDWPADGSLLEGALLQSAEIIFLEGPQAAQCQIELRRLLGNMGYPHLLTLLSYIKTCHLWTEAYPELSYDQDPRAQRHLGPLLQEEPRLAGWFKNYRDAIREETRTTDGRMAQWKAQVQGEWDRRFQLLADNAQDIIFRFRLLPTPGLEYVSPAVAAITGYTPEELYADPQIILDSVHQEDRPLVEAALLLPELTTGQIVLRVTRKDGSVMWIEERSTPIQDRDGAVIAVEGIARNVTARREAEEHLRASEEKFRQLLEHAPDAIVIINETGRIAIVNAQTEKVFGYSRNELIGRPVEMLVPERFREYHERHRAGFVHHPSTRPMGEGLALAGRRKDGSEFPVDISLSPLATVEGLLINATIRDITERKRWVR